MKAFDGWTAKFIARVAQQGVKTSVKMQGPYADVGGPVIDGSAPQHMPDVAAAAAGQRSSQEPLGAIIIAGGVSITPAMAVLQELAAGCSPGRLPVLLLWSFRQRHELELLCPPLLALAGALRLSLTTRLFYTGPMADLQLPRPLSTGKAQKLQLAATACNPLDPVPNQQQHLGSTANAALVKVLSHPDGDLLDQAVVNIMTDPDTSDSDAESSPTKAKTASQPVAAAAAAGAERTAAAESQPRLFVSPLAPGVSLGSVNGQAWLKALLLLVAYAGTLAAVLAGHHIITSSQPEPLPTNQAGALINALMRR
ncbi:hypothetical protein OEZ85_004963 [Tetradesmus obliquus]|uniref:Ferric reductase NAD binding domain-containing protein n=1 Tax=Tetradesmus obliquus TaxID=3088 RepID=A0ABY8UGE7_TETOB|nr:hypothetical protein OEZ85_004963 [Tetradesmus obliquus]